jgi:hypothetical protein
MDQPRTLRATDNMALPWQPTGSPTRPHAAGPRLVGARADLFRAVAAWPGVGEAWAYVTHQPPDAWAAVMKPAGCVQLAEVAGDPFAVGPWC